ncbi:MAG: fimbrillin family protein, partial [Clostridium sp.]|nr:fimbrillin family protein [Clostridium sp.]
LNLLHILMKKIMLFQLIATCVIVFVIFVLVSCTKDELIPQTDSDEAKMQIQSIVNGGLTRSAKEQFQEGDRISINVTGGKFENPYDSDRKELYTKRTAIYEGGKWNLDLDVFLNKKNATVYAHYPVSDEILLDMDKQVDYLVGKQIETTVNSTSPTVNISMKHVCSLLWFRFKQEDYNGVGVLTAIRVKNGGSKEYIVRQAGWDFETEKPSHINTGSNSVVVEDPTGILTLTEFFNALPIPVFVIPTLEPTTQYGDIFFEFTIDGKEYTWKLPAGFEFENGYIYNYDITLNSIGLILGGVSIESWEMAEDDTVITITN